ncbi:DUF2155 domain-containing protein [Acuticoccus sp. I52.16.1]|nr:DUF2155 domain-containing protein [Acuticoccus sp. I52.16.1]UOM36920.1 DUF2155 domain-containing protein [Acuticoccus sp. I52.16.1]
MLSAFAAVGASAALLVGDPPPAEAAPIENPVAVFSGLDKVTGRIISFDVYINETVQFGALRVTPRTCQTQPPTEEPNTVVFAEVDEITLDSRIRRIFTGWMFAASPGLNAVEHPVYDVWLKDCALSTEVAPPPGFAQDEYAQDEMGVIERPEGWQPIPKPRPPHTPRVTEEVVDPFLGEDDG